MPKPSKKYIICGRIPGDDDDILAELSLTPDECPTETFIEKTLYDGNIPADWQTRRRQNLKTATANGPTSKTSSSLSDSPKRH